jgi:hypothetical protein
MAVHRTMAATAATVPKTRVYYISSGWFVKPFAKNRILFDSTVGLRPIHSDQPIPSDPGHKSISFKHGPQIHRSRNVGRKYGSLRFRNRFSSFLLGSSFAKQRPKLIPLMSPYVSRKFLPDILTLYKLTLHFIPGWFDNAKDKSFKLFQVGVTNGQVDTESVP